MYAETTGTTASSYARSCSEAPLGGPNACVFFAGVVCPTFWMAAESPVVAALRILEAQPWDTQETCYGVLMKLLENVAKNPDDVKFRSVKRANAAIKAKVLDIPGGAAVLLAAGFQEEAEAFVFAQDASMDLLQTTLASLREHAERCSLDHLRAIRDEKIAREKEIDAKLNEHGGKSKTKKKRNQTSKTNKRQSNP